MSHAAHRRLCARPIGIAASGAASPECDRTGKSGACATPVSSDEVEPRRHLIRIKIGGGAAS
jgi:hypothetical protein